MTRSGELPTLAAPNTSRERRDADGNVIQRRYYDGNGRAVINIDYDHDHGAGCQHGHDWDWLRDPPVRLPGRPLAAGEQ